MTLHHCRFSELKVIADPPFKLPLIGWNLGHERAVGKIRVTLRVIDFLADHQIEWDKTIFPPFAIVFDDVFARIGGQEPLIRQDDMDCGWRFN